MGLEQRIVQFQAIVEEVIDQEGVRDTNRLLPVNLSASNEQIENAITNLSDVIQELRNWSRQEDVAGFQGAILQRAEGYQANQVCLQKPFPSQDFYPQSYFPTRCYPNPVFPLMFEYLTRPDTLNAYNKPYFPFFCLIRII